MGRVLAAALALASAGLLTPASAQQSPAPAVTDPHAIIVKMIARNPALEAYTSRVHVDVRMTSFPFFSPKLDGTTYYRRPDTYEVVFDRVPSYAKGFSRLFDDIGDPAAWEKDQNVEFAGVQLQDGRPMLVLRLTKKIHSDILDHTLAFVDPQTFELQKMEWDYTSGGKITMTQNYRMEDGFSVLAAQHAQIDIPHIHAVADATYGAYHTNDAAEAKVPSQ